MPFLIALAGLAVAAYFWMNRARDAAHMTGELADMAGDIAGAARRFGFRRRANVHPVEAIEDPNLASGSIAVAFLELDDYPSQEEKSALVVQLQSQLNTTRQEAEEIAILGRWFISECGGASAAVTRLSRKLYKMSGGAALSPVLTMIQGMTAAGNGMSDRQISALDDMRRAFRVS